MTEMKDDKEKYLREFGKLKQKYEKCILDLQNEMKNLQLMLFKKEDDHKTTQMHLKRYQDQLEYMISMQKLLGYEDANQEGNAKEEALQEHVAQIKKKEFEKLNMDLSTKFDEYLQQDLQKKKEDLDQNDEQFEREWQNIYKNMSSIQQKLQEQ